MTEKFIAEMVGTAILVILGCQKMRPATRGRVGLASRNEPRPLMVDLDLPDL